MEAGAPEEPGFGYSAIALPAEWPLVPRPVAAVDASVPAYAAAGVAAFADDDVETQAGEIDQIVVADLGADDYRARVEAFEDWRIRNGLPPAGTITVALQQFLHQ